MLRRLKSFISKANQLEEKINEDLQLANEYGEIAYTTKELTTVIHNLRLGKDVALRLKSYLNQGSDYRISEINDAYELFIPLKDSFILRALKNIMRSTFKEIDSLDIKQNKIDLLKTKIEEIHNFKAEYSDEVAIYAMYVVKQLDEKLNFLMQPIPKEFEVSSNGDFHSVYVPRFNFMGQGKYSPDRRYIVAGHNERIVLIDYKNETFKYIYDIFNRIDINATLITNDPYIVVRDIKGLGKDRCNGIYLIDEMCNLLFRAEVKGHIRFLALSKNAEYVACMTNSCELLLFEVSSHEQIASFKTPRNVYGKELVINSDDQSIMLISHDEHVYTYYFGS